MSDLLSVDALDAFYGESQVLFDVSIAMGEDEVVGLFGRNGMGKTTLLRSIVNQIDRKRGTVTYGGADVTDWDPHDVIRGGIAYVPEDRAIYPDLTVRENLELAAIGGLSKGALDARIEALYDRFERLRERADRPGGTLSGGEQQMLAIARGLLTDPDLLLLDEPTEGLAPIVIRDVVDILRDITERNKAVLIVEQNVTQVLPIIDRGYIIEKGRIVADGDRDRLGDEELQTRHLSV